MSSYSIWSPTFAPSCTMLIKRSGPSLVTSLLRAHHLQSHGSDVTAKQKAITLLPLDTSVEERQ